MKILLFRGRGLVSSLIRFQTWSKYSHVATMLDDGSIIEAWPGVGVHRMLKLPHGASGIDFFEPLITSHERNTITRFLIAQIGKPYDWRGVFQFVLREHVHTHNRWFCSDLVAAAFNFVDVPLLNLPYYKISPAMVSYSTRLHRVEPCGQ
jgi:uncharacterized protein YycO